MSLAVCSVSSIKQTDMVVGLWNQRLWGMNRKAQRPPSSEWLQGGGSQLSHLGTVPDVALPHPRSNPPLRGYRVHFCSLLASLTPLQLCKSQLRRLPVPSCRHPEIHFPRCCQNNLSKHTPDHVSPLLKMCFPPQLPQHATQGPPASPHAALPLSGEILVRTRFPWLSLPHPVHSDQAPRPLPGFPRPPSLDSEPVHPLRASSRCFSLPLLKSCQTTLEVSTGMSASERHSPPKLGGLCYPSWCPQQPEQGRHILGAHYLCSEPNRMQIRKFRDFPPFLALPLAPWLLPSKGSRL